MPNPNGGALTPLNQQARQMQDGWSGSFYGAGEPLQPVMPAMTPRQWDFSPGTNTVYTPRHSEPFGFRHLRAFANVELVRMAIETRKDQLERQDWTIKPRDNVAAKAKDRDPRCIEAEKFFAKPDGVTLFQPFFRAVEEDLLSLDAPVLEVRRNRGGKMIGLELVDGATINLLVDNTGRRPRGPDDAAFQQIIRGVVWANLTNRDLIYAPRNVRTGHLYGFSPVEQIIVTINMVIKRQASQLSYFTEGNVPAGILTAPEGWQNDQIRDLQKWFDERISGDSGQQRSVVWTPYGAKYQSFKDSPIKDEFDEWLARQVAFAFSLPPTPFIRQMNKGTAGEDQERALEEGLEPLKLWRKRLIDQILATELNAPDLEFVFKTERELDAKTQAAIDDLALRNGSLLIDEARDSRGQGPLPDGAGAKARVYFNDGAMTLDLVDAAANLKANPVPPPAPVVVAPHDPAAPAPKPGEHGAAAEPKPGDKPADDKKKVLTPHLHKAGRILPPDEALGLSVERRAAKKEEGKLVKSVKEGLGRANKIVADKVQSALDTSQQNNQSSAGEALKFVDLLELSDILDLHSPLLDGIGAVAESVVEPALAAIGVDAKQELVDQVSEAAVSYARQRAAELVSLDGDESLIASTRRMLRDIIADGLERNIGKDEIVKEIHEATVFSEARAELIAHTEIAMANSAGKQAAWNALRADGAVMVKQWWASGEEGVCDECQENEDEGEIDYESAFSSGDDFEPGHPACRCVVTVRVTDPGEADGETSNGEHEE